ncbi:MAG: YcjF family protein [Planctomycetia bacterium]|nr:YcjF family protein [Planctomycetia bacterium]
MNDTPPKLYPFDDEDPNRIYGGGEQKNEEPKSKYPKSEESKSDTPAEDSSAAFWRLDKTDETITPPETMEGVNMVSATLRDSWGDAQSAAFEESEPPLKSDSAGRFSAWGCSIFCLLGGVFGIYCLVQGIRLWQAVETLPTPLKYGALAIFGVLLVAILVALVRLTWFYWCLTSNRQQYLAFESQQNQLRTWEKHVELARNRKNICRVLRNFVRNYPRENLRSNSALRGVLVREKRTLEETLRQLDFLCQTAPESDSDRWLEQYQKFQEILDAAARHSLDHAAKIVGLKTAISPNPLWDMMIVLYWSFRFMRELCAIYHLRANFYATCRLVAKMWTTAICSSAVDSAEDFAQVGAEHLGQMLTSNKVFVAIFGQAATKTASGVANYYLFRRLGNAALEQIRPLVVEKK